MKNTYILDINTLPDPKSDTNAMAEMPKERIEKCLRYVQEADRKRSLGSGRIIQQIVGESTLTYGKNGKPEADGIFFNISHSGKYVIGVSSNKKIGCDIEEMTDAPLEVADRYFHCSEKEYICKSHNPHQAFWEMWTLKESYMKMTGEGMSLPLDKFEVVIDKDHKTVVYRDGKIQPCVLELSIHDNHMIAICKEL